MIVPELPTNIRMRLGASTNRHWVEDDFQKAMEYCAVSLSNSHLLSETQFEKPEGLEHICRILETGIQRRFEFPVVMSWALEEGISVFYIDVFFEIPNAPFSHAHGALH